MGNIRVICSTPLYTSHYQFDNEDFGGDEFGIADFGVTTGICRPYVRGRAPPPSRDGSIYRNYRDNIGDTDIIGIVWYRRF